MLCAFGKILKRFDTFSKRWKINRTKICSWGENELDRKSDHFDLWFHTLRRALSHLFLSVSWNQNIEIATNFAGKCLPLSSQFFIMPRNPCFAHMELANSPSECNLGWSRMPFYDKDFLHSVLFQSDRKRSSILCYSDLKIGNVERSTHLLNHIHQGNEFFPDIRFFFLWDKIGQQHSIEPKIDEPVQTRVLQHLFTSLLFLIQESSGRNPLLQQ
jgi:hypothetical protein